MACGSENYDDCDILSLEEREFNVKWSRFSEWLHCICVVTFDLELGQAMECVYPPGVKLTDQEKCNICYLAFPDSNSGCMGDTQFHVRLRTRARLTPQQLNYNEDSVSTLRADSTHYWGFVYFRQVKDTSIPRGYFQKSIILLTRLPYINLFYKVIQLIAPRHFEDGERSLEAACHDINRWPPLDAGHNFLLPVLGTVFQSYIPNQQTGKVTRSDIIKQVHSPNIPHIVASIQDVNVFDALSSVISHLHLLWELVLTAEPIVVMASSPTECSSLVQALTYLIQPLSYSAEYRPYFTIHDSEFKEFTRKQFNPPCVILGVTNPFFTKTLQHWPHTIKLSDSSSVKTKLRKVGNMKQLDTAPGVYTQYKPFLEKDKAIIKKLHNGIRSDRPSEVQTAMVKRHLLELTQSFMIPLERYMASLMPLQKNISPFRAAPIPNPFNPEDFFSTLQQAGPHLTTGIKGDWIGLYRNFFRTPNFSAWFHERHKDLTNKLQALQLEALAGSDLKVWSVGKKEVEIVDMVLKLKEVLKNDVPVAGNTRTLLSRQLEDLNGVLAEDMKSLLNAAS
ncbi:protein DENND6A [Danaus plexippus]|uniref:protein DENND6A n=1 Tax=Danaus plexippus TaxID=13037 RepID=UPI002AB1A146|nr:protein DENND6A [Danaus plexippus]